jgi:hypothetical protein
LGDCGRPFFLEKSFNFQCSISNVQFSSKKKSY